MADTPLVVLGVDPGSQRTGWGIIAEQSGVLRLVDCGIIRTTSSGEKEFSQRLAVIYRQLADVVGSYRPQEAAIEQVFTCLVYPSPSPRDRTRSRMPASA